MSTWNAITIEKPGDLTLSDAQGLTTSLSEYTEVDEREDVPPHKFYDAVMPGRPGNPDGCIKIAGHSKYDAEESKSAALELTKEHPGLTITFYEEWSDDEVGYSDTVYRNGEKVDAESKHSSLVPDNLAELIADARAALNDVSFAATALRDNALVALVQAFDPHAFDPQEGE